MKKLIFVIAVFFFLPFCQPVLPQSLTEIIDLHFDAVKQDKFNKMKTMVITSELIRGNTKMPVKTYFKRPDKMRMEITRDGVTKITAYDGNIAWSLDPGSNNMTPEVLTGAALEETKFDADLDGYFFCYRERNHTVTLEGREKVQNKEAFKIKCKISPTDSSYVFLDAKNYLIVKVEKKDPRVGNKETYFTDYKKVEGVNFPFKFEIIEPSGKTFQVIKSIEPGVDLPDSLFTMPK